MSGWIKLHRQIEDSRVWESPELLRLFLSLALDAAHETKWIKTNSGEVKLERGQIFVSLRGLAEEFSTGPSTIRGRLKKLERMENITAEPKAGGTIVTICNYELYQANDVLEPGQQVEALGGCEERAPGARPARALLGRNKKEKKVKKEKNNPPNPPEGKSADLFFGHCPPGILDEPRFHAAWSDWTLHRREIRKKLTKTSVSRQLKKLASAGLERAVEAIERSIENGWTGLFPEGQPEKKGDALFDDWGKS